MFRPPCVAVGDDVATSIEAGRHLQTTRAMPCNTANGNLVAQPSTYAEAGNVRRLPYREESDSREDSD